MKHIDVKSAWAGAFIGIFLFCILLTQMGNANEGVCKQILKVDGCHLEWVANTK